MKKLIAIAIAIIAIIAMTVPAMADVPETVTVGAGSATAPYMIALGITPDEKAGDGVQIYPEPAQPNGSGTFTGLPDNQNGWKIVKFYVEIGHVNYASDPNGSIGSVIIDVNYPNATALAGDPLYVDRAGQLKFEINAVNNGGSWSATTTYPYTEMYPDGTIAVVPPVHVRQLVWSATPSNTDMVDWNANLTIGDDGDVNWQTFLNTADKVNYGDAYTNVSAFNEYHLGQALVLEIKGWFWFHQPGVDYPVKAKAQTAGGAMSSILNHTIKYQRLPGMYIDFSSVNYGTVAINDWTRAPADNYLTTPNKTTIWNNGNADADVYVASTKMVLGYTGNSANIKDDQFYGNPNKTIESFDATLYYTNLSGTPVQIGTILYFADTNYGTDPGALIQKGSVYQPEEIGPDGAVLLQSCRPAKIEFSVHPESGQEAGSYKGFITLTVGPYTGIQAEDNT